MKEVGHILVVDDDRLLLQTYESVLVREGWTVATALDGLDAMELVEKRSFDVIITDINMPGYGGLAFARAVREIEPDVAIIVVTGMPTVDSSIRSIEYGVYRYLVKPVASATLLEVTSRAARLHKLARLKRRALELVGEGDDSPEDAATLQSRYSNGLQTLWTAFQPIVSWSERRVHGYEALLRSGEPSFRSPQDFLGAAKRLGRSNELGREIRSKVAAASRHLPPDVKLFVNLNTSDLDDEGLCDSYSPLSGIAHRVVLEITERASIAVVKNIGARVKALKAMGFRIAVDDLGAGYAGLMSFTLFEPEAVKLDMSLIRGIDADPKKQSIVSAMVKLCGDLDMLVVAEGVESASERDTLVECGCDLLQGYLFGRPERAFTTPKW